MSVTSAELASHDDILTEIFLRLPIRSLVRFKCVSKNWQYLVSSSRFALLRRKNPNPNPCGLFIRRRTHHLTITKPEYDFVPFDRVKCPFKSLNFYKHPGILGIEIVQSQKGLLLCRLVPLYISMRPMHSVEHYVYNPTIDQFTIIPKFKHSDYFESRPFGMTLVFDPLNSPHYKVVCVRWCLGSLFVGRIEVYSSETRSWAASSSIVSIEIDMEFMGGVYWNNAVHWINGMYIVYVKINETHVVNQIALPNVINLQFAKWNCCPVVESCDSLLFIDMFPSFNLEIDVYKMKTNYSGWSIKYHVHLSVFSSSILEVPRGSVAYWKILYAFVVHCLVIGEREEDSFLVLQNLEKEFVRYNLVYKTCEKLCDLDTFIQDDNLKKVYQRQDAFLFIESLSHV